jgi:hypothetical protein
MAGVVMTILAVYAHFRARYNALRSGETKEPGLVPGSFFDLESKTLSRFLHLGFGDKLHVQCGQDFHYGAKFRLSIFGEGFVKIFA